MAKDSRKCNFTSAPEELYKIDASRSTSGPIFGEAVIDNRTYHKEAMCHAGFGDNDATEIVGSLIEELIGVTTYHGSEIDKVTGVSAIETVDTIGKSRSQCAKRNY